MKRSVYGFSIIELLVAVAITGVLMSLAMPSFSTYLRNVKLRAVAENLVAGIQLARSEALRMNTNVEFLLTNTNPLAANVATAAASATGVNWMVRTSDLTTFIDGKFGLEGSGSATTANISVRVNDNTAPANLDPDAPPTGANLTGSIVFDGLGRTSLPAAAVFKVNDPGNGTCVTAGGSVRCLRVMVAPGGQVRVCDPAATSATDTRRC